MPKPTETGVTLGPQALRQGPGGGAGEVLLTARAPSMLYDDRSGLKDSEALFDKLAIPMPNLQ